MRVFAGLFALSFILNSVLAQGVTTSSMTGFVIDQSGNGVAGAAVTAVHTPTNTTYTATTNAAGRFYFAGVPVGGPYNVSAKVTGYSVKSVTNLYAQLGTPAEVELAATKATADEIVQLEKFQVSASATDLDAGAAGAGTTLDSRRIQLQPTVGRNFSDLMKTNPFVNIRAGEQATALGINSRFNSITVDGAKINDAFGLNSSGQFALKNPFSFDAIDQVSIELTPYDIRESGAGGLAMNVVSKSGTNTFHGTVYDLFTDQNWQNKDIVGNSKNTRPIEKDRTYGWTLGGPIIKNHLFFFINWEKFYQDRAPVIPALNPDPAFLTSLQAGIAALPGSPKMGDFGNLSPTRLSDDKKLYKIDWNIFEGHRLTVRYSENIDHQTNTGSNNASSFSQPAPISGQPTTFPFSITGLSSNYYTLPSKEKVWAAQLNNNWTADLKTQFQFSQVKQNSLRETPVSFPEVRIFNVPGTDSGGHAVTSGDALRFGTEISSMGNGLIITDKTFSGSADYTWNAFTFTAGADHEKEDFTNFFRQGSYGVFDYNNLADFLADKPFGFERAVVGSGLSTADISRFTQTGVFAQLKWAPTPRFNAMFGFRVDHLGSPLAVPYNAAFEKAFGVTNAGTIDGTTVPAPRFSFNYALDKDRLTQIRGGLGVFLGRNPWVWISNSYGNFGLGRFTVINTTTIPPAATSTVPTLKQFLGGTYSNTDPAYKFDPQNPIGVTNVAPPNSTQTINLMRPGLKLPTNERGNLAIDRKLPFLDAVFTIEYIHNTALSALFVDNMNLRPTTVGVDGRQLFAGATTSSPTAPIIPGFGNVIRTRNVHEGYTDATALVLDRPMKNGWMYNIAYTHTHATEAQTLNSSTANSQWQFNAVFNQNAVEVARSDYGVKDRVGIAVGKEFRFKKDWVTTISMYYEGRTGVPFSYVYSNDLNKDGFNANDLVTVPTGPNDPRFDFGGPQGTSAFYSTQMTDTQKTAYFDFLQQSGLSKFAGGHTVRNAFTTPWQNRLDLHVEQDLPLGRLPYIHKVKLTVFADFLNFGSWFNRHLFNYTQLLNQTSTNGGQVRQLGAATYGPDGRIRPTFNDGSTVVLSTDSAGHIVFGPNVDPTTAASSSVIRATNGSTWRIQAGARLSF